MPPSEAAAAVLCLASVSPRRSELLRQIGVPHLAAAPNIDERVLPGEPAADYVRRMARAKADAVRAHTLALPVLAADTIVVLEEEICGKPGSEEEGVAMLARLSGRTHRVLTAVALAASGAPALRLSVSEVHMRAISAAEARAYWHTGEPHDKAGGYAVQGRGAVFIEHLAGSYSGVMGLPLFETAQLLRAAGIPCWLGQAHP
ncbi:MAG TPA: Maf family protein [Steroidobacteraceae bacterium]|jgi:septum formation protein|nr:Maf family protein [Steroidobacteraceae bacterium]